MYSYAYDMARNDNDVNTMTEIRVAFVKYMDKMFDHYEAYSQEMFGRQIPQTMVLTPSRLVADSADDLFGMIRNRGYSFVSMNDALADDAYKTPENMFGQFGNSWFERWTYSQGKKLATSPRSTKASRRCGRRKNRRARRLCEKFGVQALACPYATRRQAKACIPNFSVTQWRFSYPPGNRVLHRLLSGG